MFDRVRRDCQRYFALDSKTGRPGAWERACIIAGTPGLHAVFVYRFGAWINRTFRHKLVRAPFKLVYGLLDWLSFVLWGIHIDSHAEIGGGLYIGHPGGILIGPVRMGVDCNIAHHVTIGRRASSENGVPTFGDRVWIGTQSVVFGGIRIGDGVTIGPLTVVARNLPPRSFVMGNPMRVMRLNYDNTSEVYGIAGPLPSLDMRSKLSFKRRVAITAVNLACATPVFSSLARSRTQLRILAYHRVLDVGQERSFEFDPDLISASTADFDWQMQHLRERYDPIGFHDLVEFVKHGTPLPPRPVIVTFDDGFDDNYRVAFPILRALRMPATFFVSTGYIGRRETFWFDWFFYLARHAIGKLEALVIGGARFPLDGADGERQARRALQALWTLPDDQRRTAIETLERSLGMAQPQQGFAQSMPMDWDQVREMAAAGMELGSHTVSHPILSRVNASALRYELVESKRELEERLGRSICALAYPVGGNFAFNREVEEAAREAGYDVCASYVPGTNPLGALDLFRLKRIHVEREVTRAEFAASLAAPALLV